MSDKLIAFPVSKKTLSNRPCDSNSLYRRLQLYLRALQMRLFFRFCFVSHGCIRFCCGSNSHTGGQGEILLKVSVFAAELFRNRPEVSCQAFFNFFQDRLGDRSIVRFGDRSGDTGECVAVAAE